MSTDELLVEARARITWGDEPASVETFLASNGLSHEEAAGKVSELFAERARLIRKAALRDAFVGAAILALCVSFILYRLEHPPTESSSSRQEIAIAYAGAVAFYGLWRVVKGLFYLLRPQSQTSSITEL